MARPSRKDEILQAALACFTEHGVDVTTIEMIRDRSGASIGSLYHHFGNKERIIAALYLAGTAQYADLLQRGFASAASAEACVKLLVTSYIDWVVANPDWARFILHSRSRVEAGKWAMRCAKPIVSILRRFSRRSPSTVGRDCSRRCRMTVSPRW